MAINLIDILQSQLGDSFAKQASSFLGESEDNTKKAMGGILPALLGTIAKKGADEKGAGALLDIINNQGFDGSMLNNISGLFGGGSSTNNLLSSGSGLLSMLMGDSKIGNVVNLISTFSGMGKNSSKSLLSMAAPLLMSVLGKQVKSQGLGVSGLMNLLGNQQGFIQKMLPAGLSALTGVLGFADMGDKVKDMADNAADRVSSSASNAAEATKSGMGRLLPILAFLAAAALAFFLVRSCGDDAAGVVGDLKEGTENVIDKAGDAVNDAADKAGDMVDDAANALSDAAKAARDKLAGFTFEIGSFGDRISKYLGGARDGEGRFAFDNVTFDTGSSNITEDSKEQLNQLVTMLEAYPKTNIGIEGFTDNTGNADANVKLSLDRANAVKAYLMGQGIAADRMESQGFGAANPVADNGTPEGREQNRRIEIVVK